MSSQLFTVVPDARYIVLQLQIPNMDMGACDSLHALLEEQIEQRSGPVILDLSRAKFLPSLALGELVRAKRKLEARGNSLVIVGLSETIRRAMRVSRLEDVFVLVHTLQDVANGQAIAQQ